MQYVALLCLLMCGQIFGEEVALRDPVALDMYTLKQDLNLADVRERLGKIRTGMAITEVLKILGKPGVVWHGGFTYHDKQADGSLLLGSKNGEVQFERTEDVVKSFSDIPDASGSVGASRDKPKLK